MPGKFTSRKITTWHKGGATGGTLPAEPIPWPIVVEYTDASGKVLREACDYTDDPAIVAGGLEIPWDRIIRWIAAAEIS